MSNRLEDQTGKWVEVRYKLEGQRFPRRMVGVYLGFYSNEHKISLRPEFGTASLHADVIQSWKESSEREPQQPTIIRGELT